MTFNILALDGGGIRGLITAKILDRLDAEPAIAGWRKNIRMIAGTSTGGILALGLGSSMTPAQLVSFYKNEGAKIFKKTLLHEVKDLGNLIGAEYDNGVLQRTLKRVLGTATSLSSLKPIIVVPTCNLDGNYDYDDGTGTSKKLESWKPKIFHNDTEDNNGNDGAELAWRVALRTSAAPTYFPTFGTYVDGGVVANNPSMVAIAQALVGGRALGDLSLLSIGTGMRENRVSGVNHDWGAAEWLKANIVDLLMDGPNDIVRYECARLLGSRTLRVNPVLDRNIELGDASVDSLRHMEDIVEGMNLTPVVGWIKDNFF